MRITTDHVTNYIVPVAATTSLHPTTAQVSAASTRQLATGIAKIDSTARALRDQAEQLKSLLAKFFFKFAGHGKFRCIANEAPPVTRENEPYARA